LKQRTGIKQDVKELLKAPEKSLRILINLKMHLLMMFITTNAPFMHFQMLNKYCLLQQVNVKACRTFSVR